ncbi:MAG: serine protease [Deltaproteobacteria bacterium]|nr:MAG: serine protease [Deltaproteobacteria bacterium]RLC09996.1 MAG: serine protease [Deltaproteobacteria bacterium]
MVKPFNVFPILLIALLVTCWMPGQPVQAYTPKEIYQKAGPGVVFIFASKGASKGSGGTGSIITPEGLIITNAHLFTQKDSSKLLSNISVFLKPDRVTGNHKTDLAKGYRGEILAYDLPLDLALVRIVNPDRKFATVPLADSEIIDIGEQVYAIGHPEQGGLWSLTTGVISARWKNYGGVQGKNLFQTDASINRGNSGGPLLDDQASMIGINSMIARKAADGLTITDVNFSIRTQVAIDWLNQNGYTISAVQQSAPKPQVHAQKTEKPKAPEEVPEKTVLKSKPPVKKEETIPPMVEKPSQKQPVLTQEQPKKETVPTPVAPKTKKPAAPKDTPSAENLMPQKPKQGKILTEKKPYHMDSLLEGMREMEDLMEEMQDMMDDFKERRKK